MLYAVTEEFTDYDEKIDNSEMTIEKLAQHLIRSMG
jgi:hypothetical protein